MGGWYRSFILFLNALRESADLMFASRLFHNDNDEGITDLA